ncbi:MAG: cytochrome c [Gammaproteobacteria bacterium]|nr:cytochrome c [Gammaproteobacteria bacterium]
MNKNLMKVIVAGILTTGFSLNAMALDGAALYKNPAKGGCMACHGPDGKKPLLPVYPKLAGQNEGYIIQQMKDIKSGARNNGQTAAMKGIMHMVNDEEIAAIAKYLAGVK